MTSKKLKKKSILEFDRHYKDSSLKSIDNREDSLDDTGGYIQMYRRVIVHRSQLLGWKVCTEAFDERLYVVRKETSLDSFVSRQTTVCICWAKHTQQPHSTVSFFLFARRNSFVALLFFWFFSLWDGAIQTNKHRSPATRVCLTLQPYLSYRTLQVKVYSGEYFSCTMLISKSLLAN